jgi:hypothetical protein
MFHLNIFIIPFIIAGIIFIIIPNKNVIIPIVVFNIPAPILRSSPIRVVGMPVPCANLDFKPEIPIARFHEKIFSYFLNPNRSLGVFED